MMLRAVSFVGFKGSGKTSAIVNVAKVLREQGYVVATIKHMPEHDLDFKGTDTYKQKSIVHYVIAVGKRHTALIVDNPDSLTDVLRMIPKADFVLIEGFKKERICPRVLCVKRLEEIPYLLSGLEIAITGPIATQDILRREVEARYGLKVVNSLTEPEVLASIIKEKAFLLPGLNCGKCGYDCSTLAELIVRGERNVESCRFLRASLVKLTINGTPLELNEFLQKFLYNMLVGALSTLKGFHEGEITIRIRASPKGA